MYYMGRAYQIGITVSGNLQEKTEKCGFPAVGVYVPSFGSIDPFNGLKAAKTLFITKLATNSLNRMKTIN